MTREREGGRPPERPNLRHLYLKRKLRGESYDAFLARVSAEVCGMERACDECFAEPEDEDD